LGRLAIPHAPATATAQPFLTAVLPAHNEAASIGQTIRSLCEQARRPDRIIVVCDNCTDDTAERAIVAGAEVFTSVNNKHRKAGALNQALAALLPTLSPYDLVLVMDADCKLNREWTETASEALRRNRNAGAVCGLPRGEEGHGLIGQLQRNEYVRCARLAKRSKQAAVLSGSGTMFRASSLLQVSAERGRRLPGAPGECYNTASITEDNEITLALKTLGRRCLVVEGSQATTELMPTWRLLWGQRVRWQTGSLGDLRFYGVTRVTTIYWLRQMIIYSGAFASLACWAIISSSLSRHLAFNLVWGGGVMAFNVGERIWTVRKGGWAAVLLAVAMLPELAYDFWRIAVYLRSLTNDLMRREAAWVHVPADAVAS
jgi:cellulose synthase/poly-beta-1,6-N-acetylglucosamine synthase-like glycosyltransferase